MFQVTFQIGEPGESRVVRVDLGRFAGPWVRSPRSILDIALQGGVHIDHACGGCCACTTCHVKVVKGQASCSKPTEDEEDMLDTARNLGPDSRLACQCVPDGSQDLVVVIPRFS